MKALLALLPVVALAGCKTSQGNRTQAKDIADTTESFDGHFMLYYFDPSTEPVHVVKADCPPAAKAELDKAGDDSGARTVTVRKLCTEVAHVNADGILNQFQTQREQLCPNLDETTADLSFAFLAEDQERTFRALNNGTIVDKVPDSPQPDDDANCSQGIIRLIFDAFKAPAPPTDFDATPAVTAAITHLPERAAPKQTECGADVLWKDRQPQDIGIFKGNPASTLTVAIPTVREFKAGSKTLNRELTVSQQGTDKLVRIVNYNLHSEAGATSVTRSTLQLVIGQDGKAKYAKGQRDVAKVHTRFVFIDTLGDFQEMAPRTGVVPKLDCGDAGALAKFGG